VEKMIIEEELEENHAAGFFLEKQRVMFFS
jgi:hypothetical protein